MPGDRSESRRRSSRRHLGIVQKESSRRSRSRSRIRGSRQRRRSSAAPRTGSCSSGSANRRSRRSTPREKLHTKSRTRSVVISPWRHRQLPVVPTNTQGHEPINIPINYSSNRHSLRRLQTPRVKSVNRSRSPVQPYCKETSIIVTPQPVSIDTVNTDLLKCIKESLQTISAVNPQSKERFTNNNVVPEFDPKSKTQSVVSWLNKVKECSEIYGWDSKQTTHYALPKLVGTAKKWYEGQPTVLLTWDEWVEKIKSAFPSYENYGHLLAEMLAKRAKFGDDLEEYYYEKLILLNRCGIVGRNAIDCIVYGIDDRSIRYGAEAVGFDNADKLLGYLRSVKHERLDKLKKKPVSFINEIARKPEKNDIGSRVIKCYNCQEMGHGVLGCKKPIVTCQKCKRIGHNNPLCARSVRVEKVITQ